MTSPSARELDEALREAVATTTGTLTVGASTLARANFRPSVLRGLAPLGALADHVLCAEERRRWESFASERRRREWLAGRIALKLLAIEALASSPPALQAISVVTDPSGAPSLRLEGQACRPHVSLSHSHDRVAAALIDAAGALAVGVDIERPRRRFRGFAARALTDAELQACPVDDDERAAAVTLRWSIKEAAVKCLRRGFFEIPPRSFEVIEISTDGSATLRLHDAARDRFRALGAVALEAWATTLDDGFVYAEAVLRGPDRSKR